ncbi:helix-turn-helix transcriptional regulator [uncultured Enterococcus sp.]|uniref:helix-turn-helix domain-containing protein n=1 Tax=uncultured Enterococcus sp. TaxID=167972 RepID=UPI002AA8F98F|nr:helix-turn-helix transcriptional regulator [uncultured Enterococcus sp.]
MTVGENIKHLRKKSKLKQPEFGKIFGVNPSNVSNWEVNRIEPPLAKLRRIAEYFDVSLDLLIDGNPEDFDTNSYYNISDYGKESRKIFQSLDPDEKEELIRTMYEYRIRHNRKNRPKTAFSQQQLAATLLLSTDIVLQEFGAYIQEILEAYEEIHDTQTKQLLFDITMYLSEGKEQSKDFDTLIRDIIEKIFPLSNFRFAYEKGNLTIMKMSKQFHLKPAFVNHALHYYIKVKGPRFNYKGLDIDLSPLTNEEEKGELKTEISIQPSL